MMYFIGKVSGILFAVLFLFVAVTVVFGPLWALTDIRAMLKYGTPLGSSYLFMIGICCFMFYLSLRINSFGWFYRKWPILWPIFQMGLFMFIGTGIAATLVNSWAEDNFPSKGIAIFLAVVSLLFVRMAMSFWFYRYPVAPAFQKRGNVA